MDTYFETGLTVATDRVHKEMKKNWFFNVEVYLALTKYSRRDWGNCGKEFILINERAAERGTGRIMGTYNTSKGEIWIITDGPKCERRTTVLFPGDQ